MRCPPCRCFFEILNFFRVVWHLQIERYKLCNVEVLHCKDVAWSVHLPWLCVVGIDFQCNCNEQDTMDVFEM